MTPITKIECEDCGGVVRVACDATLINYAGQMLIYVHRMVCRQHQLRAAEIVRAEVPDDLAAAWAAFVGKTP